MNKDHIISDICRSIPLTNVGNLCVAEPPFSSAFWRKILGHLPNLRCLKLSEGDMLDLASILSVTPYGHTENVLSENAGKMLKPPVSLNNSVEQYELYYKESEE